MSSNACGISLPGEQFVIIGGSFHGRKVTLYNKWGYLQDLPKLSASREGHGCSSYKVKDGNVRLIT